MKATDLAMGPSQVLGEQLYIAVLWLQQKLQPPRGLTILYAFNNNSDYCLLIDDYVPALYEVFHIHNLLWSSQSPYDVSTIKTLFNR